MEGNNSAGDGKSPSQPEKFSRYRSVRAKSSEPKPVAEQPSSVTRAPSRYHRRPQASSAPPLPVQQPPKPNDANPYGQDINADRTLHKKKPSVGTREANGVHVGTNGTYPAVAVSPLKPKEDLSRRHERHSSRSASTATRPPTSTASYEAAREEARMILEGEFDRMQRLKQTQEQEKRVLGSEVPDLSRRRDVHANAESQRKAKEQARVQTLPEITDPNKRDDVVPETQPVAASKLRALIIGGKTKNENIQPEPKLIPKPQPQSQPQRQADKPPQLQRTQQAADQDHKPPETTLDAVRAFDAPVSAVNAGDRRVEVKCNQASITLPVTPSTTVKDLLNSASVCMSEHVDPKTAVLLESFSQLGLERPLRRYERIRDVMNSWDTDMQNHLIIMAESECAAVGLEEKDAPRRQPAETSLQMYHSLKPGKWDKRWVNLREDGQVTVSKNDGGLEGTNICHLSDFDLYTPSRKQAKKIKTPKKICLAIKSQQKSAMFLHGTNFVHFFCSNDKVVADKWYNAVQSWRSWYLVNVLGEGQRKPEPLLALQKSQKRPGTAQSADSIPYQLGSFKPLLDFSELRLGVDEIPRHGHARGNSTTGSSKVPVDFGPGRGSLDFGTSGARTTTRNQALPPSSFPKRLIQADAVDGDPIEISEAQPFIPGGLLARSASKKLQGGHASGRGVQGAKGKPLVNLQPTSEFTNGSLLRRIEALAVQQGAAEPIIDREKRIEANVRVGEGYD